MSITDELREWFKDRLFMGNGYAELTAIADRIDAEHQKALDEWKAKHGQMWLKGYSECHAELLEGNETLASDLERCGWIRLPKDADGEYIHVGDVMELTRLSNKPSFEVRAMRYDEGGWEVFDRLGDRYEPFALRHYHAPTVEDVLREFSEKMNENLGMYTGEAIAADEWRMADERTIAKYAAKLRLAEEDA